MENINRNSYLDNFKGILIFLVVFCHLLYGYKGVNENIYIILNIIYIFFMQAFVFISGYLTKIKEKFDYISIIKFIISYLIINSIMAVFIYITKGSNINILKPYYSCWYLLALVFWRVGLKYIIEIKYILPISIIISLLVGFHSEINNIFALSRTISFFPFFIGGYMFKENNILEKIKNKNIFIGIFTIIFAIIVSFYTIDILNIKMGNLLMNAYKGSLYMDFIKRILITIISCIFIFAMIILVPKRNIPFLTKWGRNSLIIYLFHRIITLILLYIFPKEEINNTYIFIALILGFVIASLLGFDKLSNKYNCFIKEIAEDITYRGKNKEQQKRKNIIIYLFFAIFCIFLMEPMITLIIEKLL